MAVARAEARRQAARDRADMARAEAALAARSGTRLSEWAPLDAVQTDLLLQLVSDARDHRQPDGTLLGRSADGRWGLAISPIDPPTFAVLRTPDGRLVLPDGLAELRT